MVFYQTQRGYAIYIFFKALIFVFLFQAKSPAKKTRNDHGYYPVSICSDESMFFYFECSPAWPNPFLYLLEA